MTPESSPFRPGQPVPAELFVGRHEAIERLRGLVRAADRGVFKTGFISGERGIGKSSLASFVRHLCERESRVTGCHVYLGGIVGRKLLEPQIFQAIQSDRYRSILRKMADSPQRMTFQRGELTARLAEDERRVLDNFLRRMRSLGALEIDTEVRGGYRSPSACMPCISGWSPN